MPAPVTFETLFDPDFLTALSRWNLGAKRVAGNGRHGGRLSRDLGFGIEFKDYRPYSAGDDLRAIDWNLYRRLGKVFVRLFEEEQDLPIYLMPDISGSMFLQEEGLPSIVAGLRAALALAVVGLNHHDSAGLFTFSDRLEVIFKPKSGSGQTMQFARQLSRLAGSPVNEKTSLVPALHRFANLNLRRGLLVLISDFFDPAGIETLREALRPIRHKLLFIQLVRPTDANPKIDGEVRLIDCETSDAADLTVTPAILARYQAAYAAFNQGLEKIARSRHGELIRINTEGDILEQMSVLFEDGGLMV